MVVIRRYHNMPKGIMLTPEQQEERREAPTQELQGILKEIFDIS